MVEKTDGVPNPKRVAAGRRNRCLRRGLTPEGRERLRQTALANRPWERSTGPKSAVGKAKIAESNKRRAKSSASDTELKKALAEVTDLLASMTASRNMLS